MKLEYTDIFGDGEAKTIEARITADHSTSSYGLPVVVLDDGGALDGTSWTLLGYRVIETTKAEAKMMERWLKNLYAMIDR